VFEVLLLNSNKVLLDELLPDAKHAIIPERWCISVAYYGLLLLPLAIVVRFRFLAVVYLKTRGVAFDVVSACSVKISR
jgi:hypothetical protein